MPPYTDDLAAAINRAEAAEAELKKMKEPEKSKVEVKQKKEYAKKIGLWISIAVAKFKKHSKIIGLFILFLLSLSCFAFLFKKCSDMYKRKEKENAVYFQRCREVCKKHYPNINLTAVVAYKYGYNVKCTC